MTGPEHYREAERLVDYINEHADTLRPIDAQSYVAEAQVHATLALAAAQTNADTIMLCDHGAFPCSRCLNTQIADHLFSMGWTPR